MATFAGSCSPATGKSPHVACDCVIPLIVGWSRAPRSEALESGGDEVIELPATAVLAHGAAGWLLLDTGPPAPWAPAGEGDPLLRALAAHGLAPADVGLVAVSHLQAESAGGLGHFAHGPPLFVQRPELIFALGRAGAGDGYWRPAFDRPGLRWRGLRGDAPLAPGVDAVATPGHTPGHMSFLVRMTTGPPWLFAADAIALGEGVERDAVIGTAADPLDAPLRRRSHDRLVALARAEDARLVPGRCAATWQDLVRRRS
jgi:glyoxylase-like metal-dependent hydrolase (beta-lactamase superfamily II)